MSTESKSYHVPIYFTSGLWSQATLGLGVNQRFMFGFGVTLNTSEHNRSMFMINSGAITEVRVNVTVAFAVGAASSFITRVELATPANSITVTLTANLAAVFSNTGNTTFNENERICGRFLSDDATNPATVSGYCARIRVDGV